jgi:hypothetical protein
MKKKMAHHLRKYLCFNFTVIKQTKHLNNQTLVFIKDF